MSNINNLLKAKVHIGHKTKFYNPSMKNFIYCKYNNMHIINIDKTLKCINESKSVINNIIDNNEKILFIGTKKQIRSSIRKIAFELNQYFIINKWIGGMITNWDIVKKSIDKLKKMYIEIKNNINNEYYTKKEILNRKNNFKKLKKNLFGIVRMNELPKAIFVIDSNKESTAIKEAKKKNIITFAITDTNSNIKNIDYVIPANDDSIKSINICLDLIFKKQINIKRNE
ncbi:30S ribosomal protein S2 [Candidatus Nardonella dryophthoridicola]|uniref:Small ribosomal subunit protein uS2 n=1 Tax=endosymbiont of Rhynchophorus ferrugineus TaxID=1972133 RepID=A0A2Z5TGX6_9GAMM|nr:30S ribosomal protein S2 [Candidatus Nardonella dryophthoridicola]BBA85063.1 30S ribosomal protein S2 [endosymbiont of Rhynchophorus ferrugineus]